MADSVSMTAPAKLNLALAVGAPDGEGMHPICSWMVTVDFCDELTVTRLEDGVLSRYAVIWHAEARRRSDIDWSMSRDLAVRAHLALETHVGRELPIQMKLEKRIPVGGGLGGGSSDAAAMLRAVNRLHGLGLTDDELRVVAATLGSDVPFFIGGGSAIVEGLGEQVRTLPDTPSLHAVIALPEVACPTGHVYRLFDELGARDRGPESEVVRALAEAAMPSPEQLFNDLAAAAVRAEPDLGEHLDAIGRLAERPAQVAGSGSSLFVLCDDPLHASALAEAVEQHLGLPAIAVQTVSLEPT